MAINAKVNGQFTPEFAAYTKLVLVNRIQNQARGIRTETQSNSMSFQQFMEAIQKDQEVNHAYARPVSENEVINNRIYEQNNGLSFSDFATERYAAIERDYELGLVDRSGVLLASFQTEA